MSSEPLFALIDLVLIPARTAPELQLNRLNQGHLQARANEVLPAFREIIVEVTYRRSTDYMLARGRI